MTFTDTLAQWIANVGTDLARYVIFAFGVWFVLWIALAPLMRGRKIRPDTPGAKQMTVEFFASLRSIAIFSTFGLIPYALSRLGLFKGQLIAESWGPVWFWTSLVLMILAHDAYFYWAHRLVHHPRLFRIFHRRHHRSMNPSPFTAYSFDIGEAAVMAAFVPIWVLIVPTHWEAVGLFVLHQIVRNTLGHSGYEIGLATKDGRPLFDWMTTTTHHDLHHAQAGWNYGLYFTWWDRWMGTEHPDYHARFAAAVRKTKTSPVKATGAATAAALLALVLVSGDARAQTPAEIAGDWATPGLGLVVRLAPCAGDASALCGVTRWAWDPSKLKPGAIGAVMLRDARFHDGAFRDGVLVSPEDGRSYRGEIRVESADLLRLKGCAGPFCQQQVWRRLSSIPRP
jgi:sterol desaturase/sphingolipid hydroxylase (fatty acid hydroxylase superfamily)